MATGNIEPNVYCDGKWLVVPIEGAVFPNRCVKTNEPVDAPAYTFEGDLLWQQVQIPESAGQQAADAIARALFGGAGGAVLELTRKRRLKYQIGLGEERQAVARNRWRLGIGLVILGPILAMVLGTGIAAVTEKMLGAPSWPLAIGGMAIGMVLMVVGIVLFGLSSAGILRVKRSDGQHVWLEGASPEFLATLPESPKKWTPRKLFG